MVVAGTALALLETGGRRSTFGAGLQVRQEVSSAVQYPAVTGGVGGAGGARSCG